MSANGAGYTVIGTVHVNKYDNATGNVVPGWEISVRDLQTQTIVPVFVPDTHFGQEQARALIEHELDKVRSVHALGE